MRRREFITLVGGAAAAWPLMARAQQQSAMRVIGFFSSTTLSSAHEWVAAFQQRLRELDWVEGRNVAIEYRWGEGDSARFAEIAGELVGRKVDIIVAAGGAVVAAMQATSAIPIVFAVASDPVGSGLVASLAHPGGNVTGLSLELDDTSGQRLEVLREILPRIRRLAVMANPHVAVMEMRQAQATARKLGIEVISLEIRQAEDIAPALAVIKDQADALYVATDPVTTADRIHICTLALNAGLPTTSGPREFVEAGGLVSYGASYSDLYRRAADCVDKILRGTKPADLPVQQPTKFELAVNLKTAKSLNLTVPPMLLARADVVIE
jgi:putative tryptophan/tyrosine transport system substrate-binding protein